MDDESSDVEYPFHPCIGSGYCCKKALCWIGVKVHGSIPGPCPSLVYDDKEERHWCGEILKADKEQETLKAELYVGAGCCSSLNSDRQTGAPRPNCANTLRLERVRGPHAGQDPSAIPVEFLIAFVRQIIRLCPSSDALHLATRAASDKYPLTEAQIAAFLRAVRHEQAASPWPEGFF